MQKPGIDPDDEFCAREQAGHDVERLALGNARARQGGGNALAARLLVGGTPGQHQIEPARRQCSAERDPIFLRPLLGGARRGVQQHGVTPVRNAKSGAVEPVVGRTLRHVAQRQAAQRPVARDRVQIAADTVTHVVECGGERLADARPIVTMPPSVRHARDNGGAQQALAVHDVVIVLPPNGAQAAGNLGKRCRRKKRFAPAAPRYRNNLGDRRMQTHQRGKSFFHQPGKARLRVRFTRLGHRRHVMDHIAKGRCLDE